MKSSKSQKTFRVISRKTVFRGYVSELDVLQIQTASGRRVERELIRHPGAVIIIPWLADGRLILIRQLRIATGGNIWEFPAGTLEKGETARRCAERELEEETGWKAGRFRPLLKFYPTPGISNEVMYLFLGDDLKKTGAGKLDPDEELRPRIFSPTQVERMIQRGSIVDGKTILGFLFFQRYIRKNSTRRRSSVGRAAVS